MKKLQFLTVFSFAALILMSSCGGSKKVQTVDPYNDKDANAVTRVKIEKEECQVEAEKDTKLLRGYGIGTSGDQNFGRNMASMNARNEISNAIRVVTTGMIEGYRNQYGVGLNVDEQGKANQIMNDFTDEVLVGAEIICSNTYMIGDKYEVHVCIELTNEDFIHEMHSKLTDEEKIMTDFRYEEFKDDYEKRLEAERARR